jgi:hypothetical protein
MDYQGTSQDNICPACAKHFRTTQGLQAHLTSAHSCSWWKKGNLENKEDLEELDDEESEDKDNMEELDDEESEDKDNEEELGEGFYYGWGDSAHDAPPELQPIE